MNAGAVNPSGRIAGHQAQEQPLRWRPGREPAESGHAPQDFGPLVQFEMAKIFLDDGGHRLAKSSGKILYRHGLLLLRIGQQSNQACGQVFGAARAIKLNGQLFDFSHLTKVRKIRTQDRDTVGTSQVSNAAATGRRRIRHNRDRGTLK